MNGWYETPPAPLAQVSKLEATIAFRQAMIHSNLADTLVAPLTYALRIGGQSERQLRRALDTTKLRINIYIQWQGAM